MEGKDMAEFVISDPLSGVEDSGFTVSFVKADEKASISSNIKSQVKRLLKHTDVDVHSLQVYYEDDDSYEVMDASDFTGQGEIVSVKGYVPIGSIKINSSPRSSRSYAQVISEQGEVNIK